MALSRTCTFWLYGRSSATVSVALKSSFRPFSARQAQSQAAF